MEKEPFECGYYDGQGNACIKVHVHGVKHSPPGLEFEGIVDTGFSGFLQMPVTNAFSLGLPLEGTILTTLADGSQQTALTALARTTFQNQTKVGIVILSPGSDDVLIGMDFLRKFNQVFTISKKYGVLLTSEDWLSSEIEKNR